ncbi:polysaccharide export protein [Spongiibacter marinus]|jgi:polysaccharide export outer membrane protein|uniref:polysaccharide export protein n=1 Tax=Spongiibacter marinus TaxID=354246 RepID=UPI00195FEC84|nr:polysaccharide export protein [Spongiibacter marinus]MBM7424637.1 polysaccharide export outer membrane protein [Spongiibacter marinus]
MKVKNLLASALVLSCAACTVVPGSNMSRMNSVWFDDTPEDYTPAETEIRYIPINATLLANMNAPAARQATLSSDLEQQLNDYQYRVGPGDVLTITVWEHPELTIPAGSFRTAAEGGNEVKADGTVFYPYAGELQVNGLTTAEIKAQLEQKLASVIKRPQVDVRVADFRSQRVYVSGAVRQPGVVPVTKIPLTLIDAIEQLGGLANNASWGDIQLTRNGETQSISLRSLYETGAWSENLLLQHGDLIHVPRNDADKVFVLGEVNRPQGILMSRTGTSLAEALASANGINENRADGRGIYVLRNTGVSRDEDGMPVYNATIYHLNAASAVGFMLADKFTLSPRDIVYVSPAPITRWNRFLSQLLPSIIATDTLGDIENQN